jgi:hypothetical protein
MHAVVVLLADDPPLMDVGVYLMAAGVGILGGFVVRSLIRHGKRGRRFQRRWAIIGTALFAVGYVVAVVAAWVAGEPVF